MSQNVGKIQESDCFTVIVLLRFEGLHFQIPHQGQTKDYKIGICCFYAKSTTLKSDCCVCELAQ